MDRNRLVQLAEACEKASGPSFALETEIYKVVRPDAYQRRLDELLAGPMGPRLHPVDYDGYIKPPAYTASLDAAVSLVPAGWRWCIGNAGFAGVEPPTDDPDEQEPETAHRLNAIPALALCAAALRARAASDAPEGN